MADHFTVHVGSRVVAKNEPCWQFSVVQLHPFCSNFFLYQAAWVHVKICEIHVAQLLQIFYSLIAEYQLLYCGVTIFKIICV